MQKTLQDLHILHERNERENIMILVEERGDAFRGIPKLRLLVVLEYRLGVPLGIPKLRLLPLLVPKSIKSLPNNLKTSQHKTQQKIS